MTAFTTQRPELVPCDRWTPDEHDEWELGDIAAICIAWENTGARDDPASQATRSSHVRARIDHARRIARSRGER